MSIFPMTYDVFLHTSGVFCPRYIHSVCNLKQLSDVNHSNSFIFPCMLTDFLGLDSMHFFVDTDFELLVLLYYYAVSLVC